MAKKRPTLDAFLNSQKEVGEEAKPAAKKSPSPAKQSGKSGSARNSVKSEVDETESVPAARSGKPEIIRHMLYLPLPVYDQLQGLIYEEQRGQTKRRKTHDYLLDAIDLLFKKKGLKSIDELTGKE
jgi:hypothetical protein